MKTTALIGRCIQAGNCIEGMNGKPGLLIEASVQQLQGITSPLVANEVVVMNSKDFAVLYGVLNAVRVVAKFNPNKPLGKEQLARITEVFKGIENSYESHSNEAENTPATA